MKLPIAALALLLMAPTLSARQVASGERGEWAQWRGADGTGVSSESDWISKGKEASLWSAEVGLGYSSVVISHGRLYTMGHDAEMGMDVVFCLDALTGEEVWSYAYPSAAWVQDHRGGTVNTPTLDGERLFVLNREGTIHCLDARDGEPLWENQLKQEHDLPLPNRGFCGSPLIVGERMILNVGKVLCVDKTTGEPLWMSAHYGDGYATPALFDLRGESVLGIFNGDRFAVLELTTGEERYVLTYEQTFRNLNAATPVVLGETLFLSSRRLGGGLRVGFGDDGVELLWNTRNMETYMSGCVMLKQSLFGFDGNTLRCIGLDGEDRWGERGMGEGAVVAAGKRLIVINDDGELIVAEANPDEYVELTRARIFDDDAGYKYTIPVLLDGLIYCRSSAGVLVCRDHRAPD